MKSAKVVKVFKYSVFFKDPDGFWRQYKTSQDDKEIAESQCRALRLQGKEASVEAIFSHNKPIPPNLKPFKGYQVRIKDGFPARWRSFGVPIKNLTKAKRQMYKLVSKGFESCVCGTGHLFKKVWD